MFFDLTVKTMIELWFLPYRIIGYMAETKKIKLYEDDR